MTSHSTVAALPAANLSSKPGVPSLPDNQSSMRIRSMISAGFALNIGGIVLVTLLTYLIATAVWSRTS